MSIPSNRTPENYEKLFAYGKLHIDEYYKLVEFINVIYKDISFELNVKIPYISKYCKETMNNYSLIVRSERKEKRREELRNASAAAVPTVAEYSDSDSDWE